MVECEGRRQSLREAICKDLDNMCGHDFAKVLQLQDVATFMLGRDVVQNLLQANSRLQEFAGRVPWQCCKHLTRLTLLCYMPT